jgi:uncharacterized protein YggE
MKTSPLPPPTHGQENARLMDQVIRALVDAGIRREDIRTSGYSLFPQYAPQPRGVDADVPRITGYRASNQVAVRTSELNRLGELIDIGLEAGANRMAGVSFELRDSQRAQNEALGRAVQDARAAAETMASSPMPSSVVVKRPLPVAAPRMRPPTPRSTRSRTLVSIACEAAMLWKRIWKGTCMTELRDQPNGRRERTRPATSYK